METIVFDVCNMSSKRYRLVTVLYFLGDFRAFFLPFIFAGNFTYTHPFPAWHLFIEDAMERLSLQSICQFP